MWVNHLYEPLWKILTQFFKTIEHIHQACGYKLHTYVSTGYVLQLPQVRLAFGLKIINQHLSVSVVSIQGIKQISAS